jgi:hypothetical protein
MKTTPLILGIASDATNLKMVETLFSRYYDIDISNRMQNRSVLIKENPVEVVTLWVDDITKRIMSWDMFLGIAGLWQFVESFNKQWKISLEEITKFWYRDDTYRSTRPIYELIGDGRGENWFNDANRFWFKKTTEVEEMQWRDIALYDIPLLIDDRWAEDDVSDMDFPIWVNSLRTLRKRPDARSAIKDLQEKVSYLYATSWYYRQRYPRG